MTVMKIAKETFFLFYQPGNFLPFMLIYQVDK